MCVWVLWYSHSCLSLGCIHNIYETCYHAHKYPAKSDHWFIGCQLFCRLSSYVSPGTVFWSFTRSDIAQQRQSCSMCWVKVCVWHLETEWVEYRVCKASKTRIKIFLFLCLSHSITWTPLPPTQSLISISCLNVIDSLCIGSLMLIAEHNF